MRVRLLLPLLLCSLFVTARAQVEIQLEFDQNQFLPHEKTELILRMINYTGEPLRLGEQPGWIRFSVENIDGTVVNRIEDLEETGAFTLKPSARGTLRFNLAPLFKLDQIGRYKVTATVSTGSRNEHIVSAPVEFEIMSGVVLWEREFGFAGSQGTRRKYMIQQANYLNRPRLYASVTDPLDASACRVIRLGTVVSFNPPSDFMLDATNRLHVIHQVGADDFIHHCIGSHGDVIIRNIYANRSGRPSLGMNDDGEVTVIHGRRKPNPGDIPSPPSSKTVSNASTTASPVVLPKAKPVPPSP